MVYYERTSSELALNHFKEVKENMLTPPRKRRRFKKNPLPVNNLVKTLIIHVIPNMQKGVNNHVARVRSYTGVKLLINAIKAKIV